MSYGQRLYLLKRKRIHIVGLSQVLPEIMIGCSTLLSNNYFATKALKNYFQILANCGLVISLDIVARQTCLSSNVSNSSLRQDSRLICVKDKFKKQKSNLNLFYD